MSLFKCSLIFKSMHCLMNTSKRIIFMYSQCTEKLHVYSIKLPLNVAFKGQFLKIFKYLSYMI